MKQERERWRIERKVPIAIILTLMMQLAVVIAWATQLDARVSHLEMMDAGQREVRERLARFEERMDGLRRDMSEVKQQLEVIAQRLLPGK